jgi:hypothetical protein
MSEAGMKKRWFSIAAAAVVAVASLSCSSELTDNASPVKLVVTSTQNLFTIDIAGDPPGSTRCQESFGTISLQAIAKNGNVTGDFTQVRITRYRVSYVRTDGGTQVPAPFVRSMDTLLTVGGGAVAGSNFLVFQEEALNQAPFAALRPNNGARDPETGQSRVRMDVITEVFGQTLAGDNVYDATRQPITFCYACGGCS